MKTFLGICAALFITLFATVAFALPTNSYQQNILPFVTDRYDLGSSTPALEWNGLYVKNITVTGTCTGCGGGSLSGGTAGMLASWVNSSTLTSTSSPTAAFYVATSTLASLFPYASTTAVSATSFCLSGDATPCRTTWPVSSGAWPFTIGNTYGQSSQSTSTLVVLTGGPVSLAASSTAWFDQINVGSSTLGAMSTSTFYGNVEVKGNLRDDSVTSALLFDNALGSTMAYGGTSCTNQFVRSINGAGVASCSQVSIANDTNLAATFPVILTGSTLSSAFSTTTNTGLTANSFVYTGPTGILLTTASSGLALPNSALTNSTISGVSLGNNLNAHTVSGSITGSSYNGSAGVSDWAIAPAFANSFTAKQTFVGASTTALTASSVFYTPFTSGLAAFAADNHMYTLSTTSMNASITGSAGSVANALTVSGSLSGSSYNGSSAISDWAINLGNANTWTGLQKFAGAGTTTVARGLEVGDLIAAPYFTATSTLRTSQFPYASSTAISATTEAYFGIASTSALTVSSIRNTIPYMDATGTMISTTTLAVNFGGTGAASLSGFIFGNGLSPYTSSSTIAVNFGGTGSTSLGGILAGGSGLSPVKSAILSGLTWDGTTLTNSALTAAYPFNVNTPANSTTTLVNFQGGITSTASTTIGSSNSTTTIMSNVMVGNGCNGGVILGSTTVMQLCLNVNSYGQLVIWNPSTGTNASADIVMNNNLATNSAYYSECTVNGSNFGQLALPLDRPNDMDCIVSDGGMGFQSASTTLSSASSSIFFATRNAKRLELFGDGRLVMGTSTPMAAMFTIASSTAPQLSLIDGTAGSLAWTMRSISNSFFLATSSNLATSSISAFSISPNGLTTLSGGLGVSTSSPWSLLTLGSGAITVPEASSTPAASYSMDFSSIQTAKIELTANVTINLNHTTLPGTQRKIIVCQDGTGSRTVTWAASTTLYWPSHTTPTITSTAQECDIFSFLVTGATGTPVVLGASTQAF